jgi:hypothetical protein
MKLIEGLCEYFYERFRPCMEKDFKDGTIPIEYEEKKVINHQVYSAEWSLNDQPVKINVIFVDLSIEEDSNWILLFENSGYCFIFKFIDGEYSILDKLGRKVPIEYTSSLVSNFEKMINFGFGWAPQAKSNDLMTFISNNI